MQKLDNNAVIVSIDPGYDGTKVTVNGSTFDLPKKTVRKDRNAYETIGSLEGIYEITTKDGVFLFGPNIASMVEDNAILHDQFDRGAEQSGNYSYFNTQEMTANALGALMIALLKAQRNGIIKKESDLEKTTPYVVMELPHEAMNSMPKALAGQLVGKHDVRFKGRIALKEGETPEDIELSTSITISADEDHFLVISQVIACLFGYITDEEGFEIDSLKDEYPTLVIDGGYYTIGKFMISKTKAISAAESMTEYGMQVIHDRTAKEINKKYKKNYKGYDMENLFMNEDGLITIPWDESETGANEEIDCKPILKQETQAVFEELMEYLEESCERFIKVKQVLFGGGTGKIYYELFSEVAKKRYPKIKVKLVTYSLDGGKTTISPRESISAGGYKMMLNRLPEE